MLESFDKIINSNALAENIVIVDGFSATGKKLICTYLQTFQRVQKMEVNQVFGQIANLCTFNKFEINSVLAMLNLIADNTLQNNLLARDVNFRPYDGSSIFKTYKKIEYLKRLFLKDGDNIFKLISENKPILNIMTHYGMPSIDIFFEAFKQRLRFISCVRHPVYSFDHWIYILENIKKNNKRFSTLNVLQNNGKYEVPWYYVNSSSSLNEKNGDILIKKLIFLDKLINVSLKKIDEPLKNHILEIPFENFIMDTFKYQNIISEFINDKPTNNSFKYLKKEKLPSKKFSKRKEIRQGVKYDVTRDKYETQNDFNQRMNKIKNISSKTNFDNLIEYNLKYEDFHKIKYVSTKKYIKSI